MKEQGSVTVYFAREMVICLSSKGWRRVSSAERENSGSSTAWNDLYQVRPRRGRHCVPDLSPPADRKSLRRRQRKSNDAHGETIWGCVKIGAAPFN